MTAWLALLARELRLLARHGADTLAAVLFFVVAGSLFPLAIGPAPETLGRMAPGIVWVCALLAALLPLDRLFGADLDDGSLDHLLLTGLPAGAVALRLPKTAKAQEGSTYAWTENPLGLQGYTLVSRGDRVPWRLAMRTASFNNVSVLPALLPGVRLPDLPVVLASLFFVIGDVDK